MKRRYVSDITEGVIWKQLLFFFVPILLGSLFQQLYNMVDAMIVGRFVGTEALAAVDTTSSFTSLLINFFVGAASGTSVIVSQHYGAREDLQVSRAVHTGMAFSVAGGIVVMLLGILAAPACFRLISVPEEIMGDALTYIRIFFLGTVAQFAYNVGAGILRAVGDSRRPLYFLIVGCIANVFLDLLFVVVFRLGVAGAAIATVLSQVISLILVLYTLMRAEDTFQLVLKKVRFHRDMLFSILRVGIPMGLQSSMYSISNMIIRAAVNTFGTVVIAAWAVSGRMDAIVWMVMDTFGIAVTTFSAQNYGAGKIDRVHKSVRVCLLMGSITIVSISAMLYFISPYFGMLFTDDPEVLELGTYIVRFWAPFFITYIGSDILSGAIRGTGETMRPMMLTMFGTCILRVVWIFTVVQIHHTLEMVMLSYPITWVITSGMFIIYYLRGKWLKTRAGADSPAA
ncbi:MAG: MATE family efflux transporter [Ruminococcaceae bacterium]|nr:MATE family efflux transporter [Oscillospiraceae bacterium]